MLCFVKYAIELSGTERTRACWGRCLYGHLRLANVNNYAVERSAATADTCKPLDFLGSIVDFETGQRSVS